MTRSSSFSSGWVRRYFAPLGRLLLPLEMRQKIFILRDRVVMARFASDRETFTSFWRVKGAGNAPSDTVQLRLRPFGGAPMLIRPGTSDPHVVMEVLLGRYHLPPREVAEKDLQEIWDLGSNIGLTIADLAVRYPKAMLVGVELDGHNAEICNTNIERWEDRVDLHQAAVWSTDGVVHYTIEQGSEYGASISRGAGSGDGDELTAPSVSLNTILSSRGSRKVDYLKMDIEGAEAEVLRVNTQWAAAVSCIKVEVHDPYSFDECRTDLERLGFITRPDTTHHQCVVGIHRGAHSE